MAAAQAATSLVTAVVALAALIYTAQSVQATRDQLRIGEQGQITERYSRAIEQLGSPTVDVRLGALYSIERIMRDSSPDQRMLIEVLASFVRVHAPATPTTAPKPARVGDTFDVKVRPSVDIQAALTILGRRNTKYDGGVVVNLEATDLHGASLERAQLKGARLASADLRGAQFSVVNLEAADLTGADLRAASLADANLSGAALGRADLSSAEVSVANLRSANLEAANLTDAILDMAKLDEANLRTADLTRASLRNASLDFAKFDDAKLDGAHVSVEQLSCASPPETTKMPHGVSWPANRAVTCPPHPRRY